MEQQELCFEAMEQKKKNSNPMKSLCQAIVRQAIKDKDFEFFATKLGAIVCYLAEIDREKLVELYKGKKKTVKQKSIVPDKKIGNIYFFKYKGRYYSLAQLIALSPVSKAGFEYRLKNGWSIADAVETPKGEIRLSLCCCER